MSKYLSWIKIKKFFIPHDTFKQNEWFLKHQIFTLLIISFFFALGVLPFSFIRINEGNYIVGISQFLLSIFLLHGHFKLKYDKTYYKIYSILFMIFFFLYSTIIFFYVPQNHLNILWVISAPILIFFFLNKRGGAVMFLWVLSFIGYLIFINHPYSVAEFVTLISAFFITTFVMYIYELVKDTEQERLQSYNIRLQKEVEEKTNILKQMNINLEQKVEDELQKRLDQEQMLLRKSRMANMGEMIDAIAHQWRQPLMNINAVMMNIDRGIETQKEPVLLKDKVLEIFSLTSHMSHTIEDFRNLLKVEKEKKYFLLLDSVEMVLLLLKNNLKGIRVTCDIEENVGITSYKNEFSQVLITLLSNASEVLYAKHIEDKQIAITVIEEENTVSIRVEDNAGGIAVDPMEQIFDPYFTTKEQTGGTGLGLYIAKLIVEHNMQGCIEIDNTLKGAYFTIIIPI